MPEEDRRRRECEQIGALTSTSIAPTIRADTRAMALPLRQPEDQSQALPEHHREHVAGLRAQRHAEAHLLRTPADRVAHDAIQADRCQQQRNRGETPREAGRYALGI